MGIEFTHAIAWINVIKEYASKKMVDERTAAWRLAEDLKNWQESFEPDEDRKWCYVDEIYEVINIWYDNTCN